MMNDREEVGVREELGVRKKIGMKEEMTEKEEMKLCEELSLTYLYMHKEKNYKTRFSRDDNNNWYQKKDPSVLVDWECPVCTYFNRGDLNQCEICGTEREGGIESFSSSFSVQSLVVGNLIDCSDSRGVIFPAKIVKKENDKLTVHFRGWKDLFHEELDLANREDISRIKPYESCKNQYGLSKYTVCMISEERMNVFVERMKKLEEEKDEDVKKMYYPGREVYVKLDDFIYVYRIKEVNVKENTLSVLQGNEIINDIPLSAVDLDFIGKKKKDQSVNDNLIVIRCENEGNNEVSQSITINSLRKPLKEKNVIDKLTNSMISDLTATTVYSNVNENKEEL